MRALASPVMRRLVLLVVILWPLAASPAMLWFGGEDTSVIAVGSPTFAATGGTYDSNFARMGIGTGNGAGAGDPPGNYIKTQTFTPTPIIWVHANLWPGTSVSNTTNQEGIFAYSPDGVGRVYLRLTGTAGQIKLSTANAARAFVDKATATGNLAISAFQAIDWLIDYSCSGSSDTQLWIGGVKVIDYVGSLCTDAAVSLNQVGFSSIDNASSVSPCSFASVSTCWSELIVASESTLGMRLATLVLQASGNTQGWTPNTLANVNKVAISDGTFVSDSTGNVLSQWTAPTAAPGGIWGVKSVSIEARLLKGSSGPTQFDWSWRVGGANYLAGQSNALTTSFANYRLQQDTSPATSTTWGLAEVFNTGTNQLNIGIKSLP